MISLSEQEMTALTARARALRIGPSVTARNIILDSLEGPPTPKAPHETRKAKEPAKPAPP